MSDRDSVDISVIVPVYRCAPCLNELHQRLVKTLTELKVTFELVFVDDRSPDDSWQVLLDLAAGDSRVQLLRLSRNFGQHHAITAGLAHCCGDRAVVMDGDLEDPPEFIPSLYRKAEQGFDIVYAKRRRRQHAWYRKFASGLYFATVAFLTRMHIDRQHGCFSMLSRPVIDAFVAIRDLNRDYLMMLQWLGFDSSDVEFDRDERMHGESSYSILTLIRRATDALFFQTTVLLEWIVYAGFFLSAAGICLAIYYIYRYIGEAVFPVGWTTLVVLILIMSGFTIISIGVAALYIGKVFQQVKGRPLYIVSDHIQGGNQVYQHSESIAVSESDRINDQLSSEQLPGNVPA